MNTEKVEEAIELIEMFLENISEEIDRTKESIARLEGTLTTLQIERGRLETLQKHYKSGGKR